MTTHDADPPSDPLAPLLKAVHELAAWLMLEHAGVESMVEGVRLRKSRVREEANTLIAEAKRQARIEAIGEVLAIYRDAGGRSLVAERLLKDEAEKVKHE